MSTLVAHRGQQYTFPENTLSSVKEAIRCGATAVEFDVQMTADHVPVVRHDPNLSRTAGVDITIAEVNYADIKDISVGEAGRFADKFQPVTLPTLQSMVDILISAPQVMVFIELKDASFEAFGIETFIKPVIALIGPIKQRCVFIADNLDALSSIKLHTGMPIGWIIHRWHDDDLILARQQEVDYLITDLQHYDPELNHDFSADNWKWMMYDICDPAMATSLFNQGVSFVETSDICSMIKQLPGCTR